MIKPELFLMKNRTRKKWIIYKRLFHLTFDLTLFFYALVVVGYFLIAIILEGNIAQTFDTTFIQLEEFSIANFWSIVTIIPLIYLLRAFQQPGVMFSSGEYLLTILPNRPMKVWFVAAVIRWFKAFVLFLLGGLILFLFSPTSVLLIITYVCTLLFLNIMMTIVEWKFFQLHIVKKIVVFLLFITINVVAIFTSLNVIGIAFISSLLIYNIIAVRTLFIKVDWQKVTAASDFKLWNMMIVSQATKVKYKKDRQYSIWQRLRFWRKPFSYKKGAVYNRLWHLYIEKNIRVILQIVGALFLMLTIFVFLKSSLFVVAVVLTIHIYSSLAVSMFRDRLVTDVVEVLPWDLHIFKQGLLKWLLYISVIFLIPYVLYVYMHFSYWLIPQIIVIGFTLYVTLRIKLANVIATIDASYERKSWHDLIYYGLFLMIVFSNLYPYGLLIGFVVIALTSFLVMNEK